MFVNHFLCGHRAKMFAYVFNSMLRWEAPEEGMFSSGIQATAMDQLLLMLMKLLSF